MLSILVVSWNTRELLRSCLASLETHLGALQHEIIVVDCASHDGSAEMVAREFTGVVLIASEENLGFARGNNCSVMDLWPPEPTCMNSAGKQKISSTLASKLGKFFGVSPAVFVPA